MARQDLYLAEQPVGTVSWHIQGNRVRLSARCPMEAGYIYRVQLLGTGHTLNLGVMMPEGADFALHRALPLNRCPFLARSDTAIEARIVRTRPGEEPTAISGGLLDRYRPVEAGFATTDPGLNTAIHAQAHVLYLVENDMLHLAFPLRLGDESPFAPFFAATRWHRTEAGGYGLIVLPQSTILCVHPTQYST